MTDASDAKAPIKFPSAVAKTSGGRRGSYPRTVMALMLREMGSLYGRNPGGYIWAVLEPLGLIIMLAIGFSLLMRTPSLGTSFIMFFATGFLPFSMYQKINAMVASSLSFSRGLLAYPSVTWFDAVSARFILNLLTLLLVSYIIMFGILTATQSPTVLSFGPLLLSFSVAAALGLGIGLVNCVLYGLVPVWRPIFRIISRPLFLASGIIIMYEDLPEVAQNILWWNPLIHITAWAREGFYSTYRADFVVAAYPIGWALVLIAFGLLLMRRYNVEALANL